MASRNSRKFWYFARRWTGVVLITAFFALAGATIKGPWFLGATVIGLVGFIFSWCFCFIMSEPDPRDHQHCEPWDL